MPYPSDSLRSRIVLPAQFRTTFILLSRVRMFFKLKKLLTINLLHFSIMAEKEGFEPSIGINLYTLSRRAPSATRPLLQNFSTTQTVALSGNTHLSLPASSAIARSSFLTRLYRLHPWSRPALLYLHPSMGSCLTRHSHTDHHGWWKCNRIVWNNPCLCSVQACAFSRSAIVHGCTGVA